MADRTYEPALRNVRCNCFDAHEFCPQAMGECSHVGQIFIRMEESGRNLGPDEQNRPPPSAIILVRVSIRVANASDEKYSHPK